MEVSTDLIRKNKVPIGTNDWKSSYILSGDFANICGLLRIYELYVETNKEEVGEWFFHYLMP